MHADLAAQTRAFMDGRLRQLEARMAELTSEIAAAAANREEAERALARAQAAGRAASTMTKRRLREGASATLTVATETQAALRHRLAGVEVEVAGAAQGRVHRRQLQRSPALLAARRRGGPAPERGGSRHARAGDAARQPARASSPTRRSATPSLLQPSLSAPVRGSVWEVMTAPGETVVRGQELVRAARLLGRGGHRHGRRDGLQPAAHRRSGTLPPARREHAITRGASSA